MTEERVTKTAMDWLSARGWEILDYDFPGGGTGRRFRFSDAGSSRDKNAGTFCPDIVAWKDGSIILFENKAIETLSDFGKQAKVRGDPSIRDQLASAYPGKRFVDVFVALSFSGTFKRQEEAKSFGIDFVLTVSEDGNVGGAYKSERIGDSLV